MVDISSGLQQTTQSVGQFLNISLIAIPTILIVFWLFLIWRKRNRMKIPCVELRTIGSILKHDEIEALKSGKDLNDILKEKGIENVLSKFSLKFFKAGIFGSQIYLKMLFWKGDRTYRLSDTSIVYKMSDEYWQEVNGKRGIVFIRDPVNFHICIPIKGIKISNTEVFATVAPVNVKNAILDNLKSARRETMPQGDKLANAIMIGMVILGFIIGIIFMTNYGGKIIADGQKYTLDAQNSASAACKEIAKASCAEACLQIRSSGSAAP